MTAVKAPSFRPILWADGKVRLIDQTRLPVEEVWLELSDYRDMIEAIKALRIRGAPAIGLAGAYAVALAAIEIAGQAGSEFLPRLEAAAQEIKEARPTGANLAWAVQRMLNVARRAESAQDAVEDLIPEATALQEEDEAGNRKIGLFGAELIPPGAAVLTHCNAGALATGGYGTALGVIRAAWDGGRISRVFATETRPVLQGARLTAWELLREGVETTLVPDSAAGQLMRQGKVQAAIVGADRIAANGDVANKIGTYSLAVLAKENGVPFYVAAPTSTVDLSLISGDYIPIEERTPEEVTRMGGARIAPEGIEVLNPAFDVTPHGYVTAIITERGVAREPYSQALGELAGAPVG